MTLESRPRDVRQIRHGCIKNIIIKYSSQLFFGYEGHGCPAKLYYAIAMDYASL